MNKNKKWLAALTVAAMMTTSGLVMAATPAGQQDNGSGRPGHEFAGEHGKKGGMRAMHGDDSALLELLKIDAETFKANIEAGKTLLDIAKEQGVSEQALRDFVAERMTKRIDEGVANGRISAEQAQQLKDNMEQHVSAVINSKGPMHRGDRGPGFADNTKLLELLKTDAQTLKSELKEGKTLAAIAKENGVAEKKLKAFLIKEETARIDEGVKAGRLNADQAKTMKKDLDKRVSDMINGKMPMHRGHGPMHGHGLLNNQELLALLKTDAETLKSQLKDGKTLAEVAGEQGVSEQELKTLLISQITARIDEGVKNGRITADKAQEAKANLDERVSGMINGKMPMHRGHGPGLLKNQELLALLKTDAETLKGQLKDGKTLAEVADEQGVSEQELKALLTSQISKRIDEDAKNGRISAEQAQEAKADLDERIDGMINAKADRSERSQSDKQIDF